MERGLRAHLARARAHPRRRAPDRLRGRRAARALEQRGRARRRPAPARGRHDLDGQRDHRPRGRARGRARRRRGADRLAGRRADRRRGGRRTAGDDQLRGHLRHLPAGAAGVRAHVNLSERLLDAPSVRAVRDALAGGEEAWIVGGAVRDAAGERSVTDLDLAVAGDEATAARRIARAVGGPAFELSAEFGTWRALAPDRSWHADVSRLRGPGIEADLEGRDFTVNAIALPLADLDAAPLDPHGGLADAADRVLRTVSERSFGDDPLRLLRAARLAAELDYELDPETIALGRRAASQAGEPAGERQLAELRLLVAGPDPLRALALLDELGATEGVLPELAALRGVEQNPNHHLDVHGHTLEVLANLLAVERDLDRYAGDSAPEVAALLAEPLADELTRGGALRFAAVLHDVGKPATRREREDGFVSFVGHDRVGAAMVAEICARLRASRALARQLELLTVHHLHLGFMAAERPLGRRRLYDYLRLTAPVAADVTLLTVADRLAARGGGPTASPEMVEAHLKLAREVLPAALAWHRDGPPRGPIRGDELARALGIEPGPELGRLLAEIEAAVFTGEVETAEQAIRLAERLFDE
ncbi:MAG: HD domain-containing protein [Solirubrobacterales bacterium]|nr:HD domain-containing protein [Solirubrobacterales bacterium]